MKRLHFAVRMLLNLERMSYTKGDHLSLSLCFESLMWKNWRRKKRTKYQNYKTASKTHKYFWCEMLQRPAGELEQEPRPRWRMNQTLHTPLQVPSESRNVSDHSHGESCTAMHRRRMYVTVCVCVSMYARCVGRKCAWSGRCSLTKKRSLQGDTIKRV